MQAAFAWWDLNSGRLEKQAVLLTTESSLQRQGSRFLKSAALTQQAAAHLFQSLGPARGGGGVFHPHQGRNLLSQLLITFPPTG